MKPEPSKMKNVSVVKKQGKYYFQATIYPFNKRTTKVFDNERDAGKCVDLDLIRRGMEPVNILKKQNNDGKN